MASHRSRSALEKSGQAIDKWVDARRDMLISLVQELVQLPSRNRPPEGDELAAQRVIGHWLRQLGVEVDQYDIIAVENIHKHPAWRPLGRHYQDRPNLMGVLRGVGKGRSLLYTGHVDTVALDSNPWRYDPFGGEYDGRAIYGLGAFDMKGGLAAGLMAVRGFIELGIKLLGSLYFESVVDEEFGGANASLAGRLRYPGIDGAILMEPTNLKLASQHRGTSVWNLLVTGLPGRTFSGETTFNPAKSLAAMLNSLDDFFIAHPRLNQYPWEVDRIQAGPVDQPMGTRVPAQAEAVFWVETGADDNPDVGQEINAWLSRQFPGVKYKLTPMIPPLLGSGIPPDHPLAQALAQSARDVGVDGDMVTAPFACDGAMFNRFSKTPLVLLGPEGGNAHGADEYVTVDSLMTLTKVLMRTACSWCGMAD